jgi:hypothetical protein
MTRGNSTRPSTLSLDDRGPQGLGNEVTRAIGNGRGANQAGAGIEVPSIVARPTESERFLTAPSRSELGWQNTDETIVALDTKPDNFITTPAGILPIDLLLTGCAPLAA